ncbi:MAG: Carbohydrate-selective porin OprB [Caulobacter sp.]|nr:Carbohydrate-selective porin OprB [Caulobacter sp.]
MTSSRSIFATVIGAVLLGFGAPALADDGAWSHTLVYTADVMGTVSGGTTHAGRALDNLDLIIDGDLDKAFGWRGVTLHAYGLNNTGGKPNDLAGTLQGVDNIEVDRPRGRLYELWLQARLADGKVSALAGLYDLNSEFYSTEASGLLLAPPFGIGSEFAATGPNGPSIFPSTALAVRLKISGEGGRYAQAAILNARAATLGDPDGPSTDFDHGALVIAEAGVGSDWRLAVGAWGYTHGQPDLRALAPDGQPALSDARGGYALVEYPLVAGGEGRAGVRGFVRIGVSDGDTTPFNSGWQAGILVDKVFPSRPDSAFSIGLERGALSSKQRANTRDQGLAAARAESSVELTYSDRLTKRLTMQPDLQIIRQAGGDRDARRVVVMGLRLTVELN